MYFLPNKLLYIILTIQIHVSIILNISCMIAQWQLHKLCFTLLSSSKDEKLVPWFFRLFTVSISLERKTLKISLIYLRVLSVYFHCKDLFTLDDTSGEIGIFFWLMLHKSSSNKTLAAKLEKMSERREIIKVVISKIIYRYVLNVVIIF